MTELETDMGAASCSVNHCFVGARVIGQARVQLPPHIGAIPEHLTLDLPLCVDHAHLLRGGVISCDLDSRLT